MKATTTALLAQLLIGLTALLLAVSCKKDKDNPTTPEDKVLQVNFSTSSIDYNLVDSGFVILKKEGGANQVFKRFEKKTGALSVLIEDLSAGNWTAEMYIFSRHDDKAGRRFRQDKAFTLSSASQSVQLAAPTGSITDSWKPYAFFRDAARGISVAVALDNKDPHFDIQLKDTPWDYYYMERYAYKRLAGGAKAQIGEGMWECRDNCFTSDRFIDNKTGFIPFAQQVGNKEWDNGLIIIVVADDDGADVQFSYSYNL
jgi:hypothetical protein